LKKFEIFLVFGGGLTLYIGKLHYQLIDTQYIVILA